MRLDFKILWIDDQPKHVASFSDGLRIKLRAHGFDLNLVQVAKVGDVEQEVAKHVHDDLIDLVMVDYDLGHNGKSGGELVLQKVREKFPYKEILFYSATDRDSLRRVAYEAKVDGVHFSTRFSLVEDAMHVISKLLSKVIDIDHMRGIVMSASSDIDFMVEASLDAVYRRLPEGEREVFVKALIAQIEQKLTQWTKDLSKASEKGDLPAIVKLKHLFGAHDRLVCLVKHLEAGGWAATHQNQYLERMKDYQTTVIPKRNKLAHLMLRREAGKKPELVGQAESWSVEEMTALRQCFLEHRDNFQTVATLVDAPLG